MFALGEPMDASSALACGLANAVVPLSELRTKAHGAAAALTKRPAGSLKLTKGLMCETDPTDAQLGPASARFIDQLQSGPAWDASSGFALQAKPDASKAYLEGTS